MPILAFFVLSAFFWIFFFLNHPYLPPIWPDEVLFFSPAQSFANTGVLGTTVLKGLIPGMESKTLWMPPSYMLASAGFLKIFPQTIFTVRLLSALTIYASAGLFLVLSSRFKFSRPGMLVGFATILMEPLFFRFGSAARMEGLTSFFFLLSLIAATSKGKSSFKSFLAGILLSCSALSHPFGASLGLVTAYSLLSDRKDFRKKIVYFGLGGILPLLVWAFYIHPDWYLFQVQFGAQLIRKKTLLGSFDLLTKLKIFLFGFAFSKIRLVLIALQILLMSAVSLAFLKDKKTLSPRMKLFWVWWITVLLALYSSSEGWYVYHFLFPFAWGMAILIEQKSLGRILAAGGILLSLLGWIQITNLHWIRFDSEKILTAHFQRLETVLRPYKNVYLQALPDPYFYLKEKNPNQNILEFIPGELEFPTDDYKTTIENQEAFVFYNESLKNKSISAFLEKHPDWIREEWSIPVPSNHWLHYQTIVYRKPIPAVP
ncbi:ArnT family glycosyltransferase [Leptospira idonii]|uniref:Dolichyl-phosphate-mannose--protein mannosyltransferase n=1 Tax=Leptospira idonii TaxID=1193500 RepID=A0A4R9LW33_9LEPT|nr:dolichyl-phosphate-mannose--protein mannosyltransferase [Leptospira idonii]TGN17117.1 dolichyl-phosphate-mannose--protein mannosyltransferase [Leptospira idonii]